jgi:hypothetical protein
MLDFRNLTGLDYIALVIIEVDGQVIGIRVCGIGLLGLALYL